MSLPGAGWFELGWVGIVIICIAFAWIYGKAYNKFMRAPQSHFGAMLYCAFSASSIVAFRDGSIITIMKQSLFYLTPVLLLVIFTKAFGISLRTRGELPGTPAVAEIERPRSPRERRKARMGEPVTRRRRAAIT